MNYDYYSGFEGEPEIQIYNNDKCLRLWIGYFDEIMNLIKPESEGWTSLAYYYHLNSGWYEESPWKIDDLVLAKEQFKGIDSLQLKDITKTILVNVIELFDESIVNKDSVFIEYD